VNAAIPDDRMFAQMEAASGWVVRLSEAPDDEALVEEWLRWCESEPHNLPAFQRAQAVWHATGPDNIAPRQPAKLRVAIAASLVFCAAIGAWIILDHDPAQDVQSYATAIAGSGSGVLPDGSKVELGAQSRISTHYSRKLRRVSVESGEAFFTVEKDPLRPFVVDAGAIRVTAVGTAFNVRRSDDRVVVAVSEGTVRILGESMAAESAPALTAGQRAVYVRKTKSVSIAAIGPKDTAPWREGVLKYNHEPLSVVAADLSRYSRKRIDVSDPRLASLTFTGSVFSDRIEDALHGFEDVFPLKVIDRDDHIELVPN
jgi:transmembrane sensor